MEPVSQIIKRLQTDQQLAEKEGSSLSREQASVVADWLTLYTQMYPQQELTPELAIAYREGLEGICPRILHEAFKRAMRESQSGRRGFRPSVGEIVEMSERESERIEFYRPRLVEAVVEPSADDMAEMRRDLEKLKEHLK